MQLIGSDARIQRPDFEQADFKDIEAPYESGLILANPPYGERIGDSELAIELYKDMSCLFDSFEGWNMGFITSHEQFEESIGKKANSIKSLKCGNLDTKFYIY